MKKQVLAVFIALIVLAVTAFGVFANEETPTATVEITGGSLSVDTLPDIGLSEVALNGQDLVAASAAADNDWSVIDATGSGFGWHLTISSTNFTSGGHTIDISLDDQRFTIELLDTDVAVSFGNTQPTSNVTGPANITGADLTFLTAAAGTGMGSYTLNPSFELEVPAETYAGTYTATVTVTSVSAP